MILGMVKFFIGGFFVLFSSVLLSTPVLAGGQLVNLVADSNGYVSEDNYGRIMRVFINSGPGGFPCKGAEITFKFVDPKDGDYINTGSGGPTFVMQDDPQPFYRNGVRIGSICGTYAKMSSKIFGERMVTVAVKNGDRVWPASDAPVIKVHFDGKYHGDNAYDNQNYRSSFENYGWYGDPSVLSSPSTTSMPAASVTPVRSAFPVATVVPVPVQPIISKPPVIKGIEPIKVVVDTSASAALQQKIEDLERKLEQSQQKQSLLESRINQLVSWIKSIFPFFK